TPKAVRLVPQECRIRTKDQVVIEGHRSRNRRATPDSERARRDDAAGICDTKLVLVSHYHREQIGWVRRGRSVHGQCVARRYRSRCGDAPVIDLHLAGTSADLEWAADNLSTLHAEVASPPAPTSHVHISVDDQASVHRLRQRPWRILQ